MRWEDVTHPWQLKPGLKATRLVHSHPYYQQLHWSYEIHSHSTTIFISSVLNAFRCFKLGNKIDSMFQLHEDIKN